jgi:hypothetical protein
MKEWHLIDDEVLFELEKDSNKLEKEYINEKNEKVQFYSNLLNKHLTDEQQNDIQNGRKGLIYTSVFAVDKFKIQIAITISITNNISTHFKSYTIISIEDAIDLRENLKFRNLVKLTFYIKDKYKNIENVLFLDKK